MPWASMESTTTHRTGGPPVPKRRFHVQWVHIGMQGGGVCIRKISGFVKVTSRSSPTKVRSQIFYVRTSEGHLLPNRAPQSLQCRGVPTGSALRAGALALAPTFARLRAWRGTRLAWRPARAPLHSRGRRHGCPGPVLAGFTRIYTYAESGWNAAESRETGRSGRSRLRCRSAEGHTRIK